MLMIIIIIANKTLCVCVCLGMCDTQSCYNIQKLCDCCIVRTMMLISNNIMQKKITFHTLTRHNFKREVVYFLYTIYHEYFKPVILILTGSRTKRVILLL